MLNACYYGMLKALSSFQNFWASLMFFKMHFLYFKGSNLAIFLKIFLQNQIWAGIQCFKSKTVKANLFKTCIGIYYANKMLLKKITLVSRFEFFRKKINFVHPLMKKSHRMNWDKSVNIVFKTLLDTRYYYYL